ncbi:unnamed protein product [Sphagnum balticum]
MIGKMVSARYARARRRTQLINMIYILIIVAVVLVSFGVVSQSIRYPDEPWSWQLVRNVFYKPYFMLFGEVYAGEIAPCSDRAVRTGDGVRGDAVAATAVHVFVPCMAACQSANYDRTEFISMKVKDLLDRDARKCAHGRELDEQLLYIKQTQRELTELLRRALAVTGPTLHYNGAPQSAVHTRQPPRTHAPLLRYELPHSDSRKSSVSTRRDRTLSTLASLNKTALGAKRRHAISNVSPHRMTAIGLAAVAVRAAATFKQSSLMSSSHTVATPQVGQQERSQKQPLKRTLAATIPGTNGRSANFDSPDEETTDDEGDDIEHDIGTSLRTQRWLNVPGQRQRGVFAYASHRQAASHTLDATKVILLRSLTQRI